MPIFDQGYQHWSGTLSGHTWRWYAISRHGVRLDMKNWFLRLFLLFAWVPAVVLAAMLCIWGLVEQGSSLVAVVTPFLSGLFGQQALADPKGHRIEVWTLAYWVFLNWELWLSMILILLVGPNLISGDMRFNAMPLYFSRPVRRIDYFFGKLGVVGYFLGMVLIVPSLLAYALGLLFSLDFSIIRDTFPILLASIGYCAVIIVSTDLFVLALSTLSRNSRYIALLWIGVWFVSSVAADVLEIIHEQDSRRQRSQVAYQQYPQTALPGRAPGFNQEEQRQQMLAQMEARRKALAEVEQQERERAMTDWRPMASYTANLRRIGQTLIGSNASWEKLSSEMPEDQRNQYLRQHLGPRYPWYWSAGVLIVLMGLSACLLNYRVKSMDRLK